MGRPPHSGGPAFRFTPNEVAEMEACLRESNNAVPTREIIASLADKFSASAERAGKIVVQPKQVWNWFQNRRYAQRAKLVKTPGKSTVPTSTPDDSVPVRNVPIPAPIPSDKNSVIENTQMEFEAKSARDGAWYDVATFISHRMFETGDPEVRVRFAGFGTEEDEWVNVRRSLRQRSLPCEAAECVAVIPGDLVLCFQEGKEQALYFDAHILDAQRRRHDVRGCRCRFLVRYDHDQSEEIVPLRKICRRPETDYRLQQLQTLKDHTSLSQVNVMKEPSSAGPSRDINAATQKTEELVTTPSVQANEPPSVETTPSMTVEKNDTAVTDGHGGNAALTVNVTVDKGT